MRNLWPILLVCLTFLLGLYLTGSAYNHKFRSRQTVKVVGSAAHNFDSDLIVWSGTFSRHSQDIKDAYSALKRDADAIRAYLSEKGIEADEVIFSSVTNEKQYRYVYDDHGRLSQEIFTGYLLRQSIKVESSRIEEVEKISREITELLQMGIEFNSQAPLYYYTRLSELKIDLLAKAAQDARQRAETIVGNAEGKTGKLIQASMGVFQITGQNTNEDFHYGGAFNVTSKKKTATITVRLEYTLN